MVKPGFFNLISLPLWNYFSNYFYINSISKLLRQIIRNKDEIRNIRAETDIIITPNLFLFLAFKIKNPMKKKSIENAHIWEMSKRHGFLKIQLYWILFFDFIGVNPAIIKNEESVQHNNVARKIRFLFFIGCWAKKRMNSPINPGSFLKYKTIKYIPNKK